MNKKIISLLLTLVLTIAVVPTHNLKAGSIDSELNRITLEYTIYNEDGTIDSTGFVPSDKQSRYTWQGVTLKNNQQAVFKAPDGLYCYASTTMTIKYTLDRVARTFMALKYVNGTGEVTVLSYVKNAGIFTDTFVCTTNGNYFLTLQNQSSDPITVKSISLTF